MVDLLDYDVRFGQGNLFSPPRPVRAEALQGGAGEPRRNRRLATQAVSDAARGPAATSPGWRAPG